MKCTGPNPCRREAEIAGLCPAHYQQLRRAGGDRRRLRPLEGRRGRERMPAVRLAPEAARALREEAKERGAGVATVAREVLEAWARKR